MRPARLHADAKIHGDGRAHRGWRGIDADERDPDAGQEFWLVRPMYFTTRHFAEDGREYHDCFVDSDGVVRLPYGRDRDDPQDCDDPDHSLGRTAHPAGRDRASPGG
ncbi:AQJ64_40280 family protein [Microbispora siamensis]